MLRIVFFIILSTTTRLLQAQSFEEKDFVLYTTKDGLSDNDVWSIEQDAYGYIWVATKIGLNRFDGNTFQQFYSDSSRNSMPEDWVISLKPLNEEQLAVITASGLHIINTRTLEGRNLSIPVDSLKLPKKVSIYDALGDKNGNVFVITNIGFYHFNSKDELLFRYDNSSLKSGNATAGRFGYNIFMVENNTILLSTVDGPYIYYITQKDLHPVSAKDVIFYQGTVVTQKRSWFVYGNKNFFGEQIQDGKGLYWFDIRHKTKQIIPFPFETKGNFDETNKLLRLNDSLFVINGRVGFYLMHYNRVSNNYNFSPKPYFENYFCSSLLVDKNGRLWVATERGLFMQKRAGSSIEQVSVQKQENSFNKGTTILTIAIANNKVFAGTLNEGLLVFDRDSLKLIRKIDFSKDKNILVRRIIAINNDTLLIAPSAFWINTGNLNYDKINLPNWEPYNIIIKMLKDPLDNIYITKNDRSIFYYRSNNKKKFITLDSSHSDFARILSTEHIDKDTEGNAWFSGGQGMLRFNYRLQKSDLFLDSFPSIKSPQKSITSNVVFDQKGNMYFGLRANGLIIYNYVQNKFSQLTRSDGLPDNNVHTIFLRDNKMWIGTENSLASYNLSTKKISSFGVADGMPANLFSVSSFCYDSARQQLYIAFDNTIVRFNPDRLEKNNLTPDFFIESINVTGQGKVYHPPGKFTVSYKYNSLVINLAAINFEDAYQQQFAYRLVKNGNDSWQEIGSQRSIIFSDLSPGTHRLQFKVFIKNNSWPEQIKEITITVSPPFWNTTWFLLFLALIILTGIYSFYRYRIKSIRQKANIDKQLAELEMKGLHAQMNPHFIFNSLNSIKEMILEDEKQHASRYLSKFAQLIRTNLEQSKQTFISVKQSIDHLHQYLEMEKIRFGDFSYSIDVADELLTDEIQMAPMLIQPLVENAIWHGLHNKQGDKKLAIRFYRSGRQLVCEIEDNGIGINKSKENKSTLRPTHRSLGISNIHDRLNVLNEKYKMNCSLTINDRSELPGKQETGTLAVIRLNT